MHHLMLDKQCFRSICGKSSQCDVSFYRIYLESRSYHTLRMMHEIFEFKSDPMLSIYILSISGPVSREADFLVDMISAGMNIARMNFSHGTHEYHGQTIANVRKAVEKFGVERGFFPSIAIALDTKGPEIRSGILEGDDGRKEVTLEMGEAIKITTDDQYKEKCSKDVLWVDYKNITKVLTPGKRIFIDDGLISVIVKETGKAFMNVDKVP